MLRREQAAVIGWNTPSGVPLVNHTPKLDNVFPEICSPIVEVQTAGVDVFSQSFGNPFQAVVLVAAVGAIGQEFLVFAIPDKEQAKQDREGLLVGVVEIRFCRVLVHSLRDCVRQRRDGFAMHRLAQAGGQVGRKVRGPIEDLIERPAFCSSPRREEQAKVAGQFVRKEGEVQLYEGLGPALAPDPGVHRVRHRAGFRRPSDDDPWEPLSVSKRQSRDTADTPSNRALGASKVSPSSKKIRDGSSCLALAEHDRITRELSNGEPE